MQTESETLSNKFNRLRAPFAVDLIQWRVGARMKTNKNRGQALPYINARLVQDRLDEVMGPENWRNEFAAAPMGGGLMCVLSLRIDGDWVSKADIAQQDEVSSESNNPDQAREIAIKGAASDAFKRAAVQWGIGRYLYSFEAPWVNLEHERYIARDEMPKLRKLLRNAFPDEHGADEARAAGDSGRASPEVSEHATDGGESGATMSAEPRSKGAPGAQAGMRESKASVVGEKKARPSFGTDEQWASITARQRLIVKSISDRVRHNAPLGDIETFLTHGEGAKYPDWLREGLLGGVRKKIKEQAAQAGQHSEVA